MSHPIQRDEHGFPIDPIASAVADAVADFAVGHWNGAVSAMRDAVADAALSITVHRWLPPGPDPLTVSNWWAYREPCDCPDTSFGRNPHRWNCGQTPIWAQTIRDLDTNPWTVVRPRDLAMVDWSER